MFQKKFLTVITLGFVVTWLWFGALGCRAIAITTPRALCFLFALDTIACRYEGTCLTLTTWSLTGTALCSNTTSASLGRRIQAHFVLTNDARIATSILTFLIIETTITFLATLDNFVAAKGALGHLEAVALLTLLYGI